MTNRTYKDGQTVQANKATRTGRRWSKATILYIVRTAEHELGEAYMIEFADGSRGAFDLNHIRPLTPNQVIRDPAVKDFDSYRVFFRERLCSPAFSSKGAAQAYLDMIAAGRRKPEYGRETVKDQNDRPYRLTGRWFK